MKKVIINGQMQKKTFLIVIYHSSLVKAAVNAARVCILRSGLTKHLNFFFFQWPKAEQRPLLHLSIAEGSSFWNLDRRIYDCKLRNEKKYLIQVCNEYSPQLSKLLYNWQLKNKEALKYFEGLSEDGGQIFLKTFHAFLFNEDLSNEPNFSRIHLARQNL